MHRINLDPLIEELKPMASVFDELLNEGLSSILGASLATSSPRVNFIKKEDLYLLELAAPGMKKEDFSLNVEHKSLVISIDADSKDSNDGVYTRREFTRNSFKKSFHLPEDVDKTKISASYEEGILSVSLPKFSKEDRTWSQTIDIK